MATLFIPPQMRDLTSGAETLTAPGQTLGEVLGALEVAHPGLGERIAPAGSLASGLAVSIDGAMTARGLRAPVKPDSEIHILPAIGGG
jgi:molybdopterin synthase sulfur carrier subunit